MGVPGCGVRMTDGNGAEGPTPEISGTGSTESEQGGVVTIYAADITSQIQSINGFWLTPFGDDGEPDGPTTYHPTEIRP